MKYQGTIGCHWHLFKKKRRVRGTFLDPCRKIGRSRGGRDMRPPFGPKFLHFHAVFGENWPNNRLAPSYGLGTFLWEILNPPLQLPTYWFHWYQENKAPLLAAKNFMLGYNVTITLGTSVLHTCVRSKRTKVKHVLGDENWMHLSSLIQRMMRCIYPLILLSLG